MPFPTLANWFERTPSAAPGARSEEARQALHGVRARLRIGIPRILNIWTTHQFWLGFFERPGH